MFVSRKCQGNDGVILRPGDFFEANMMNSVFSELSLSILHPIHVLFYMLCSGERLFVLDQSIVQYSDS